MSTFSRYVFSLSSSLLEPKVDVMYGRPSVPILVDTMTVGSSHLQDYRIHSIKVLNMTVFGQVSFDSDQFEYRFPTPFKISPSISVIVEFERLRETDDSQSELFCVNLKGIAIYEN